MPNIPTSSKQRPWLPPKAKPFQRKPVLGEPIVDDSFYNGMPWRKLRAKKFALNPLCEVCERDSIIKQGRPVDHIKTRRLFPELELDINNLQTLCDRHHNIKSQLETYMKTKEQYFRLSKGRGAKLFVGKS